MKRKEEIGIDVIEGPFTHHRINFVVTEENFELLMNILKEGRPTIRFQCHKLSKEKWAEFSSLFNKKYGQWNKNFGIMPRYDRYYKEVK